MEVVVVVTHMTCTCGRSVEGRPYRTRTGTSTMRLQWRCKCGLVVYAYTAEDAEREAKYERRQNR
jgi:hypothetical protein